MKYLFYDRLATGDSFEESFDTLSDAIKAARDQLERMTRYDINRRADMLIFEYTPDMVGEWGTVDLSRAHVVYNVLYEYLKMGE